MKKFTIILISAFFCLSFTKDNSALKYNVRNTSFTQGEYLEYRLHYGVFNAGVGIVQVFPKLYSVNGKACYKLDVSGRSVGAFAAILKVKDTWRSYIDTTSLYPEKAYRDITEGRYRLKETTLFNQAAGAVTVKSQKKSKDIQTKNFEMPKKSLDIVSAYYYLRNVDYSKMKEGESVSIKVFFEDTNYDLKVIYKGKEKVKVRGGKFNCIKLVPEMPDNELFDGSGSVRFWLSDDANRVAVRVEADMFVGAVQLDLKSHRGLGHALNTY